MLNRVPVPLGLSMYGMPTARAMQAAQRLGIFRELAGGPRPRGSWLRNWGCATRARSCCSTRSVSLVSCGSGRVSATSCRPASQVARSLLGRLRRWLSRRQPLLVGVVEGLEDLVRDGRSVEMHDRPDDDPYWASYISGQYQIARLSSDDVAKAVELDQGATSLLDVAGGHGEFSMALCRRHPTCGRRSSTFPGAPGSGARSSPRRGCRTASPTSRATCSRPTSEAPTTARCASTSSITSTRRGTRRLFERIAGSLRPGAPLCVLDLFNRPVGQGPGHRAACSASSSTSPPAPTPTTPTRSWAGWRRAASGPAKKDLAAAARAGAAARRALLGAHPASSQASSASRSAPRR